MPPEKESDMLRNCFSENGAPNVAATDVKERAEQP
jgi:hypothetical protein